MMIRVGQYIMLVSVLTSEVRHDSVDVCMSDEDGADVYSRAVQL